MRHIATHNPLLNLPYAGLYWTYCVHWYYSLSTDEAQGRVPKPVWTAQADVYSACRFNLFMAGLTNSKMNKPDA